ncbi:hypothetical protein IDH27_04115 [Pelagibacterales bacterium SAG-MED46]|nr:hypothetical protein [Pelagibacterales bacterium SAG-MED46]
MNKILNLIFIFVFGFFINLSLQNDSEAIVCVTNADGAIQLTAAGVAGTQEKSDGELAPFQYPNGIVDDEFNSNFADQCNAEPLFYKMKVYKVALCKEDPYVASGLGSPRFESCIYLLNNPDGKIVTIVKGQDENDLLDGAELVIPTGEYPYFAMVLSNHLHVKHKQDYVNNDGTTGAKMWGNGDNTDAQRKTCYTTAVVTTITGDWAGDATYQNAHLDLDGNAVTIVDSGQDGNSRLKCVNDNSETDYDFATEIIDSFGNEVGDDHTADIDNWINYQSKADLYQGVTTDISTAGTFMAANLLQNNNASLATSFVNAQRIAMYLNYTTNPPKISENTVGIKLNIGTTMGISLDSAQVVVGAVVRTWMAKVGVDPFTVVVQVQNRDRRGARGRWR